MRLEYSAPRAIYGQFQQSNVARLREVAGGMRQPLAVADALRTATAAEWRNRGLMQLRADAPALAYDDLREAVVRQPTDPEALRAFARAAASAGRLADAEQLLADLVITDGPGGTGRPIAPALVELSVVRAARGQVDEATRAARDAVVADPMNPAALRQLASMYGDAGDDMGLDRLMQVIERAGVDPGVMLYAQMRHAYARGEFARTVERGDQLVARDEGDVNVFNLIASAHAALGQYDRARQALESARSMAPTDPGVLVNLGTVALRAGDASTAADRFSDALFLSPTLPAARAGLADAYDRQGNRDRAAALRAGGGGG
jgi:Tfp pilus assembly protein PilF